MYVADNLSCPYNLHLYIIGLTDTSKQVQILNLFWAIVKKDYHKFGYFWNENWRERLLFAVFNQFIQRFIKIVYVNLCAEVKI